MAGRPSDIPPRVRLARRLHRKLVYPLVAFALPSRCFVCDEPLRALQRFGACPACWSRLDVLRPPLCPACGLPRPEQADLPGPAGGRCASCILSPPVTGAVRAVVRYDGVARSFLLRAKLGGRPELLRPLGLQLARALSASGFSDGSTAVVAVPSHAWTNLRRGFSPAAALARPLARRLGLPWLRGALRRELRGSHSVKRMSRRSRRSARAGGVRPTRKVEGQRVLLVDDVMTTGATVDRCARALLESGAREVRVAVWARTVPGRPDEV